MLIERPIGPPSPSSGRGSRRRGQRGRHADVAPRERLDADREQRDGHDRHEDDRGPVVLAGQRDVVEVQPHQVRLANGASSGTAPW